MICHKQQGTSLPNKHFGLDLNLWRKLSNGEDVTAKLRQYHRTQCDNPWRSCFNFISTLYFKVLVYALSMSAELCLFGGFFFLVVFFFANPWTLHAPMQWFESKSYVLSVKNADAQNVNHQKVHEDKYYYMYIQRKSVNCMYTLFDFGLTNSFISGLPQILKNFNN